MAHIVLPHRSAWNRPPRPPFVIDAEVCHRYNLIFGMSVLPGWMEIHWPATEFVETGESGAVDVDTNRKAGVYGWGLDMSTAEDYTVSQVESSLIPDMSSATDPDVKMMMWRGNWLGQWSGWDTYSGPLFLISNSLNQCHGAFAKNGSGAPVFTHTNGGAGPAPPGGGATWIEQNTDMEQVTIMGSRIKVASTWTMHFWSDWVGRGPEFIGSNTYSTDPSAHASVWKVGLNRNRLGGNNADSEFVDVWLGGTHLEGDEGLGLLGPDKWAMYEEHGRTQYFVPSAGAPPAGRIMSSLVNKGGLVADGGLAGQGGGLAA